MIFQTARGMDDYLLKRLFAKETKDKAHIVTESYDMLDGLPDDKKLIETLIKDGKVAHVWLDDNNHYYIIKDKHNVCQLRVHRLPSNLRCMVFIVIAGCDLSQMTQISRDFAKYIKQFREEKTDETAKVHFSYNTIAGPKFYRKRLACPTWRQIKQNYLVTDKMQSLLQLTNPHEKGKLIFWHGPPGTGKTFLIRALMQEWKERADFYYIMDPEALFNSAGYMFGVLMDSVAEDQSVEPSPSNSAPTLSEKFKVFIIEDALDLLLEEKRKDISPAMSRLLNLTEGIIGQGFKILVLITSNEKVERIDPAFMRPGRCLQLLRFDPFNESQAKTWLQQHNIQQALPVQDSYTLADLYNIKFNGKLDGNEPRKMTTFGFVKE